MTYTPTRILGYCLTGFVVLMGMFTLILANGTTLNMNPEMLGIFALTLMMLSSQLVLDTLHALFFRNRGSIVAKTRITRFIKTHQQEEDKAALAPYSMPKVVSRKETKEGARD